MLYISISYVNGREKFFCAIGELLVIQTVRTKAIYFKLLLKVVIIRHSAITHVPTLVYSASTLEF